MCGYLYSLLVGNGLVSPGEFWNLTTGEVWWLIDAKVEKQAAASGRNGPSDNARLYDMMRAEQAKEIAAKNAKSQIGLS